MSYSVRPIKQPSIYHGSKYHGSNNRLAQPSYPIGLIAKRNINHAYASNPLSINTRIKQYITKKYINHKSSIDHSNTRNKFFFDRSLMQKQMNKPMFINWNNNLKLRQSIDENKLEPDHPDSIRADKVFNRIIASVHKKAKIDSKWEWTSKILENDIKITMFEGGVDEACASPVGRKIFLSRLCLDTNDEKLAFIIGHELGHILGHHQKTLLEILFPDPIGQERKADFHGQMLMANAGYDPVKMIDFFKSFPPGTPCPDHPSMEERADNAEKWLPEANELYKNAIIDERIANAEKWLAEANKLFKNTMYKDPNPSFGRGMGK